MTVAGGNRIDGLWFETWSRPFIRGVVNICIQTSYPNHTQINAEIIVSLHIHHIRYIQVLLINYNTCTVTQYTINRDLVLIFQ
jgi:hypothetical protein